MGGLAVGAIILAIVVAVKTFSDPTVISVKPATELITGTWNRKAGVQIPESQRGVPAEHVIARDIVSFDATTAPSGTVKLTLTDNSFIDGKVINSQPGHLQLQVQTKGGKTIPLTIAQMGEGGPMIVTDGISNLQFELSN